MASYPEKNKGEIKELTNFYSNENNISEEDEEKVIRTVKDLGITYPTEVSIKTRIEGKATSRIINNLIRRGILERVFLNRWKMPLELEKRKMYFFGVGIDTFDNFNMRKWVRFNEEIED